MIDIALETIYKDGKTFKKSFSYLFAINLIYTNKIFSFTYNRTYNGSKKL